MRKIFLILSLAYPFLMFGNMAKPWSDGALHSILMANNSIHVVREKIGINIIPIKDVDAGYYANYTITYTIHTENDIELPLLFIALGLNNLNNLHINNTASKIIPLKNKNGSINESSFITTIDKDTVSIKYSDNESIQLNPSNLVYFIANLHKGENTITVSYDADMAASRIGFIKKYNTSYSLYPSEFWKSSWPINITLALDDTIKLTDSNFGEITTKTWEIDSKSQENITLDFERKTSFFISTLVFIGPFGIFLLCLVILMFVHHKFLKKHRRSNPSSYNFYIPLGIILVPIIGYTMFFLSYDIIDFFLGYNTKHGYVFLFVITLPVFAIIYGVIIWALDRHYKVKYNIPFENKTNFNA